MYLQTIQEKRVFSRSFRSVITNRRRMHKTHNHNPHYVITNRPPHQSNGALYNGTKEKHSRQATMSQHYLTKTQTYKIIRVKCKIILDNRKTFMPMLRHRKRQGSTASSVALQKNQRPRRSGRIEDPHRI